MASSRITTADQFYATQWLHVMLDKDNWLSDQLDKVVEARDEFKKICLASKPDKLNAFCEKWLSPEKWEELDQAIATARKRREKFEESDEHHVNLELTHRAKFILDRLAKQYDCSMSEVIEQHLVDRVDCDLPAADERIQHH